MTIAIDSSVILAIYKLEPLGKVWMEKLIALRRQSRLVVCEIVVAECRPALPTDQDHLEQLGKLGVQYLSSSFETACLAGEIHRAYRATGGQKDRVIADFFVGAHAQIQADQLATDDEGFMRKYFRSLPLVHS